MVGESKRKLVTYQLSCNMYILSKSKCMNIVL